MKPTLVAVDDGLPQPPTHEEIVGLGIILTVAVGSLALVTTAMGWALKKVLSRDLDRAWDREYWED